MKRALIVVDFQNDFVDGSLGFEDADRLDEVIADKIQAALDRGDDLYFTMDTHDESYLDTYEGKHLPTQHCIKGTEGHELYGSVKSYMDKATRIFEKPTFPSLDLANHLKSSDYTEVELCGLVSNICVLSNAVMVKAALPEAAIVIDRRATDSFDKELHEKAMDVMEGLQMEIRGGTDA
jgi:nicotinamidase-related amidase